MDVEVGGCLLRLEAVYAPALAPPMLRIGGDIGPRNGHIGRDGASGRQALAQATTAGGRQVLEYLSSPSGRSLATADHSIPSWRRGTWCNNRTGVWYELDYFVVSRGMVGRCGGLVTWAAGESDHAARGQRSRPAPNAPSRQCRRAERDGPRGVAARCAMSRLRDPVVAERYAAAMAERVQESRPWPEMAQAICEAADEVLGRAPCGGAGEAPPALQQEVSAARGRDTEFLRRGRMGGRPGPEQRVSASVSGGGAGS